MTKPVYCTLIQHFELQEQGLISADERPTLLFKDDSYYWVLPLRSVAQCTADDAVDALIDHAIMLEELLVKKNQKMFGLIASVLR